MDCEPAKFFCPWDSPGNSSGVGCHALPQGIFPWIQPMFPALQADSLLFEPPGRPKDTGVGSLSLLQGNLPNPGIKLADSLSAELPEKPVALAY